MGAESKVAILNTVFIVDGADRVVFGGAERYLVELHHLLVELGYEPRVWQPGVMSHTIEGMHIEGLPWGTAEYSGLPVLNHHFHERTSGYSRAIYMAPVLAFPRLRPRSIVISHGIYWDYPTHPWARSEGPGKDEWYRRLRFALTAPDLLVSVDTNTLDWIRAAWPGHESRQVYIPNFVDAEAYHPAVHERAQVVVLYPRRLDMSRGLDDAKAAARVLTARHDCVEFHFVGRGLDDAAEEGMRRWTGDHPRCRYYWLPLQAMPAVYREADIVLIPSRGGEGTSLSCLEAMASGKVVVASHAGGLSDLVIDRYNGRLVAVTPETLIRAVEELLLHPEMREALGRRARETAEQFSLTIWRRRWARALATVWG